MSLYTLSGIEELTNFFSKSWNIQTSLKFTPFEKNLPFCPEPQKGIIYFPPRIPFLLVLYQLTFYSLYDGRELIDLNDKLNATIQKSDIEELRIIKTEYCKQLYELERRLPLAQSISFHLDTILLFYLLHELTHVRVAQNPDFFEEKKKELEHRIINANVYIRSLMEKSLRRDKYLIEETICDIEACKTIKELSKESSDYMNQHKDIAHMLNIMNSVNNIRKKYLSVTNGGLLGSYWKLTHSKETNNSISRYVFIQNYWKDDCILSPKTILNDIFYTARIFALNNEVKEYVKKEYKKRNYTRGTKEEEKVLKQEICDCENRIMDLIMRTPDSLSRSLF